MKSIVALVDKNNAIGALVDLAWIDKWAKRKSVIMDLKVFEQLGSKPLYDWQNIVVTSLPTGVVGVMSTHSLETAFNLAQFPVFVLGGEQIYHQVITDADKLYITQVDTDFTAINGYFPQISCDEWQEVTREHHQMGDDNQQSYDFVEYKRINNNEMD